MLRVLFFLLVLIHGAVHFLGALKAYEIVEFSAIRKDISKGTGILWLCTGIVLICSAILFLLAIEYWWRVAAVAVCLSQILIFAHWQDTKFATILNLLMTVLIVISYGQSDFRKTVQTELNSFLTGLGTQHYRVSEQSVVGLPEIVQRWLRHVGVVGQPVPKTIHAFQSGRMKTEKEGDWLAVSAEQWFTTETPGFIWRADVGAGSLLQFSGRDQFIDAKGKMLIKAYGMIEVVNADGPKIDQGAAVRFLSEIIWFPAAATADYISWEQTDSLSATATFSYLGQTVSGIFKFNESGQLISFLAARFYDKSGKLENWLITIDPQSETEFESVLVPTQASVTWQLAEGDFTWYDLEIIDLKYTP